MGLSLFFLVLAEEPLLALNFVRDSGTCTPKTHQFAIKHKIQKGKITNGCEPPLGSAERVHRERGRVCVCVKVFNRKYS